MLGCISGRMLSADDDDKKPVHLPDAVTKAWSSRFQKAEILSVKAHEEGFEIKAKDELNDSFKVLYGSDGRLVSEKKHKISLDHVPAQVLQTAKQWAPGAVWEEPAEVETKKGGETVYVLNAELHGQNIKTRINSQGKQLEADSLPEPKTEKIEKEKDEKNDYKPGPRIDHEKRVLRCC